jgi:hypothetical protein
MALVESIVFAHLVSLEQHSLCRFLYATRLGLGKVYRGRIRRMCIVIAVREDSKDGPFRGFQVDDEIVVCSNAPRMRRIGFGTHRIREGASLQGLPPDR